MPPRLPPCRHERPGSPYGATLDRAQFPCGSLRSGEKGVGFQGLAYTTPAAEGRIFSFIAFLRGEKSPAGGFSPLRLVQATR